MAHIPPDKLSQMRKRAEEHLARIVEHSLPQLAPHDVQTLVHELRVNQVELALQCDELERAQAEAEESRNEYRELYESIPIGYATVDAKGCLEDLNPAGIELLGLATTAMPSKSFTSYIEPDDADRFTLFCRTVVGSQGRQTGEFMMKRADGGAFVALLQAVAVRSDKGQGEQLRILFKDITSRKQAEEALLRHEAELVAARHLAEASATGAIERESKTARELLVNRLRLDSIIQSAMDAILTVDSRQQILLFNRAAELMFKCPAREAIGQPLDRFIPARFRQDHRRHVEGFGRSGVTSRRMGQLGTVTGLRTDGEEFPLEAAISHVMVEGQRYYTVILRDVSDRKRVEEALRESTERLSLLIKYAPAALAMLDRNMRFLAVSERWMADYGLGERNIVGQYHYEVFSETPDRWKEAYRRGLAGEVIREEEDLWTRADGSQLWLRWEVRPWHAADGS
ncbi:MAG TPA: PAS domain S-box protein, partial [Nitrospira sp.]|nr:PAS domain S-box protein [Nitrospira sp.]